MNAIRKLIFPNIPAQYRSNFIHLFLDIGWFGILSGSSVNFINVYAARIGATGFQIGLMGAMAAFINLIIAIPAGQWLEKRPIGKAVFWTSVLYRVGFLAWVFLPWAFATNHKVEIWALIIINLLMGIPLTALGLGFNVLFAASVPGEWRAYVAGTRNVVLSVAFMASSLVSGYILERVSFPLGYQIIFMIGCIGAGMSSFHLYFIKPLAGDSQPEPTPRSRDSVSGAGSARKRIGESLRLELLKTRYRVVLLVMLGFHLAQYLAIPIFPLYFVNELHLTDEHIGIGTALFYLTVLLGSTQLSRIVTRLGHKTVTGLGVVGLGLYPIFLSLSHTPLHFYAVSFIGGFSWSLVGGAYANYLLENIPKNDMPAHLAWYTVVLNLCVLTASLLGPVIADQIGLATALLLFGLLRVVAGAALLKWG